MASVTVSTLLNAIEVNGYPKAQGAFEDYSTGGKCAIGQAAANLHVNAPQLSDGIAHANPNLQEWIFLLNDKTNADMSAIARELRNRFADNLCDEIEF